MDDSASGTTRLFSYGTLRDRTVQLANFGRELSGSADSLPGFSTLLIPIHDVGVVVTSARTHHAIAVRNTNPDDEVPGLVFMSTSVGIRPSIRAASTIPF